MSQSGSTSASDEQSPLATKDNLQKLLDRIAHLDLTGKVSDISSTMKGHGGYSDIFTGYYSAVPSDENKKIKVAIKRIRVHTADVKKLRTRLVRELYIWTKLDHSYILPLRGYYFEDDNYPCLVSMWMEDGTVPKYLESHTDCDLQQMVLHIAEGINYLHQRGVIHSDIKPDNILISPSGEPRICDFGISHMLVTSGSFNLNSTTGNAKGTFRYMSIELLAATDQHSDSYSKASDVWAFGMTILELLTKKPPYSHIRNDGGVVVAIASGRLPRLPEEHSTTWSELYKFLWQLCMRCWAPSPSEPPSMLEIVSILEIFSTPQQGTSTDYPLKQKVSKMSLGDQTPLDSLHQVPPTYPSDLDPDQFWEFQSDASVSSSVFIFNIRPYIRLHFWIGFGKS
ncbi:hypothetical protein M0805_002784 [Coniferiporia weirii]|nr:hypothetical protein M0805_002784 [Coniferiporia weirii]